MSSYQNNRTTVQALLDRKVIPLGAHERIVRASERRAWHSICRGMPVPAAIREAVSWAAAQTDKLAECQRENAS